MSAGVRPGVVGVLAWHYVLLWVHLWAMGVPWVPWWVRVWAQVAECCGMCGVDGRVVLYVQCVVLLDLPMTVCEGGWHRLWGATVVLQGPCPMVVFP